jgi:hypothetical protein
MALNFMLFSTSFPPPYLMCKQSPLQKGSQILKNKVKNEPQEIKNPQMKKIKK